MSLLLATSALGARRAAATGPLAPLVASLHQDLAPLLAAAEIRLPPEKARLTRVGGRCPAHGVLLSFDPYSPKAHQCPTCGETYTDEEHYRWWIMNYQLWLAERAVHGAVLFALTGDAQGQGLAIRILDACADAYLRYPNSDNVLGPTRPFFSTYLESIWTLQLAVAVDLLEMGGDTSSIGARVRERLLIPSAELIAQYDEGSSNRQVWNNAAMLAVARLCGRESVVRKVIEGRSGLITHLTAGLLPDGSWYEGENYHQFAHRGLWYGVLLAEGSGYEVPAPLVERFTEAFALPFLTALPDFTFPARRDSQYAVSLRQWRYAESCELGLARGDDPRLLGALAELYRPDAEPGDTGRAVSTAEAERNTPPARLTRESLGWKSLLHARATLPVLERREPQSVHLEHQGLAVFRRKRGRVYVALDYGAPGGGHGHPDRLNLWLVKDSSRFLEDPGTGSYVERALFWYRSTWAHNAPLVNGRSQPYGAGVLKAWEEQDNLGWIEAEFEIVPGRTRMTRRVVVSDGYLIDELRWAGADQVTVELPWHVDSDLVRRPTWSPVKHDVESAGSGGEFLRDVESTIGSNNDEVEVRRGGEVLRAWMSSSDGYDWYRAVAPGPPGLGSRRFVFVRGVGRQGWFRSVWAWDGLVRRAFDDGSTLVVERSDGHDQHLTGASEWEIREHRGEQLTERTLAGRRSTTPATERTESKSESGPSHILTAGRAFAMELGERHYRRSELAWADAGAPEATLRVAAGRETVDIDLHVRKSPLVFAPRRGENLLDNEDPDINSDGVQLYLSLPDAHAYASWLLVPEEAPVVRVSPRPAGGAVPPLSASWRLTQDGYRIRCGFPRGASGLGIDRHFMLNVVINEISPDRERRRGQLVATGTQEEWVYLRGDREDPRRMLAFEIVDG